MDEPAGSGLPAFITAPTRTVPESVPSEPQAQPDVVVTEVSAEATDESNLHLRPRRRRRPKSEFAAGDSEGRQEAPASDPVGD